MSEVLIKFDTGVTADDGRAFKPRACGRLRGDGLYEGWIEFVPVLADAEVEPIRTSGETVQPNRADLLYWAAGLTQTYLDGALRRALSPPNVPAKRKTLRSEKPFFDRPASPRAAELGDRRPHPLLNPYEVYQQGERVLVQELGALSASHLRVIVRAYGFASTEDADDALAEELTRMILSAVRPTTSRARSKHHEPGRTAD